jgi:NifU-like protein involved in Fe-S cluster formation
MNWKREIKVEDVAIPEKIAILTWSGDDIKTLLEAKKSDLKIDEELINDVSHKMDGCGCGECVSYAVDEAIENLVDPDIIAIQLKDSKDVEKLHDTLQAALGE